jgi:predicted nuclease with TOPRIM domain
MVMINGNWWMIRNIDDVADALKELGGDCEELAKEVRKLDLRIAGELKDKITDLENDLVDLKDVNSELEDKNDRLIEENDKLSDRVAELEEMLEEMLEENGPEL